MQEPLLFIFLLALGALLGAASALGAVANRLGIAPVVGELAAGIVIGKTVLGRLFPDAFAWLFCGAGVATMLHGYRSLAIVLLLMVAGLEIDTGSLRRSGKALIWISVLSAAIPFSTGYGVGLIMPDQYLPDPSQRTLHAVFLGIALAISALPVITRTLMDLRLIKTEIGTLVLSSAVINDLVGWLCFGSLVRTMGEPGAIGAWGVVAAVALTAACLLAALVVVRPLASRWLRASTPTRASAPTSRPLALITVLALLGATGTELLGIHAAFGGFVVGLAIGSSPNLSPHTSHVLRDCVTSLFTPVFFAMMSLHYDFITGFDPMLVIIVVAAASMSKVAGSALGARLGGLGGRAAWAIGFGMNSRGAMEILLAVVALDTKIINDQMFVALVTMAITTSLFAAPAMTRLLGRAAPARA